MRTIYTVGHSTHSIDELFIMLQSVGIETLVDIRSLPGSRKFPWFDKENLEVVLPQHGIAYLHLSALGGRRKVKKDSHNTRWHHKAFRGYADYMETPEFVNGIQELEEIASKSKVAIMCAEAVWWRCHRSMVSDYLKAKGWEVLHIMNKNKVQQHTFTQPARVEGNSVFYCD
ncbi:MAG: DUF488 domain-containing protein [Bacteroidia bacterium]|nr:DUF488 domain-containing protein [Bacteroidia bacterium]